MSIESIINLFGGLALFLYGMNMMSTNLETIAGNRMKTILEKLTSNRFLGVLVGASVTAIVQSSSAVTVMVVGFVNSGLMTLRQAVWIIMGANIGTTITGQLIALDVGLISPLIAFIGVAMIVFLKNKKVQLIGGIIGGLGILFVGMNLMSDAMVPLRNSQSFIELMTQFSNPLIGILVGLVFTAVIQSSSASVGILQTLAAGGLIGLDGAVFVLFGQNIGTCVTAVLASIGTNRSAKRTTLIHLMFNIIGTCIFVVLTLTTPFVALMESITADPVAQIANTHTTFNIVTTLILLPFGGYLATLAEKILPDRESATPDEERWFNDLLRTHHPLGVSTMALKALKEEMQEMLALAAQNVEMSFDSILYADISHLEEIKEREEKIDLFNAKLSRRISKVLALEQSVTDTTATNQIYKVIGNLERIGDHAMNLAEFAEHLEKRNLKLSDTALSEVTEMKQICMSALEDLTKPGERDTHRILEEITVLEQQIDDTTKLYRENQLERLRKGCCHVETSILYSEMLTDYERIGDHLLNIAESYPEIEYE